MASEFRWRAPDGSEVLALKLPDDTAYSNFYYRFRQTLADTDRAVAIDPERVVAEATRLLEVSLAARPHPGRRYLLRFWQVDDPAAAAT